MTYKKGIVLLGSPSCGDSWEESLFKMVETIKKHAKTASASEGFVLLAAALIIEGIKLSKYDSFTPQEAMKQ